MTPTMTRDLAGQYSDFHVPYLVDETLREGVERGLFAVSVDDLRQVYRALVDAGLRELVIGCGPENPEVYRAFCADKDAGVLPSDIRPVFLVLLNCCDATYTNFQDMPRAWIADTVFSFGMITHRQDEQLFERMVEQFIALGAEHLKVSILNNFSRGVDTERYDGICAQIERAARLGVRVIRLNDSVGTLYPETTAVLCRQLVADFPDITFALHCHNDRGLALENQLTSIYHGFQMAEGSLCGFGNRSGMTPLELLVAICDEKKIQLGHVPLDVAKLCAAALLAEDTFMHIPAVLRPVSGRFINKTPGGVINIPDFLGVAGERDYVFTLANLHPHTIRRVLEDRGFASEQLQDAAFITTVMDAVRDAIVQRHSQCPGRYRALMHEVFAFYAQAQLTSADIAQIAKSVH